MGKMTCVEIQKCMPVFFNYINDFLKLINNSYEYLFNNYI